MHAHEHAVTALQARALITAQMPDLAGLPLRRVGQAGTDNVLFRVGPALVARFPRLPHAAAQIALMARWLPTLAPALPLAVPMATKFGNAGAGYPFQWSVLPWLAGRPAALLPPDQIAAALDLAHFLTALQSCPISPDAPDRSKSHALSLRLSALEYQIDQMADEWDPKPLLTLLTRSRALPPPDGPKVWLHGDLYSLNLLTKRHKLTAVIDWGSMGVGDAAIDLSASWTLFDTPARAAFRRALNPDPATWARARAYAFAKAVLAIPYYRTSNPDFSDVMRLTLRRVLDPD